MKVAISKMKKQEPIKKISKQKIHLFQEAILAWFNAEGRHYLPWREKKLNHYEIVIAEILLQRTKAETIANFYPGFIREFPTWQSIATSSIQKIEEYLRPIGLYRQRATKLKNLASEMIKRKGKFPKDRIELESIPFLGQYIANAVELMIFKKPSPLMDVNMARVLERYFGERKMADIRYDPYLQNLSKRIVDYPDSKEINWAILDFAALVCKSRTPMCYICIFNATCIYYKKLIK